MALPIEFPYYDSYRTKWQLSEYLTNLSIGFQLLDCLDWTFNSPIVIGITVIYRTKNGEFLLFFTSFFTNLLPSDDFLANFRENSWVVLRPYYECSPILNKWCNIWKMELREHLDAFSTASYWKQRRRWLFGRWPGIKQVLYRHGWSFKPKNHYKSFLGPYEGKLQLRFCPWLT